MNPGLILPVLYDQLLAKAVHPWCWFRFNFLASKWFYIKIKVALYRQMEVFYKLGPVFQYSGVQIRNWSPKRCYLKPAGTSHLHLWPSLTCSKKVSISVPKLVLCLKSLTLMSCVLSVPSLPCNVAFGMVASLQVTCGGWSLSSNTSWVTLRKANTSLKCHPLRQCHQGSVSLRGSECGFRLHKGFRE